MDRLWAATSQGVVTFRRQDGRWSESGRSVPGIDVTCVAAQDQILLAGTRSGMMRSEDSGFSWQEANQGATVSHFRWIEFHPEVRGLALAGAEPAAIFRTQDAGRTWLECPEIVPLRQAGGWFLPYSPESGCIRGLAFHGQRAYAAAEVGGALRSDDAGRTWRLTEGSQGKAEFERPPERFVHPDVHSIATHPSSPDLVFAPTGDGFYASRDGGKTWDLRYDAYCRAVWVDPADPEHMLLGPADDVDQNGRIEVTHDGGKSWQPAAEGLRVPWRRHMVERFLQVDQELFAVLSNGRVLASRIDSIAWTPALTELKSVRSLAHA
ncbi:MAG: WD40/YVTN/BNR-like repeat-containing protein [Anaerolineales bacterium]